MTAAVRPGHPLTEGRLTPARLAAAHHVVLLDILLELPPLVIGMAWHPRHTADRAHRWLRSAVRRALCTP